MVPRLTTASATSLYGSQPAWMCSSDFSPPRGASKHVGGNRRLATNRCARPPLVSQALQSVLGDFLLRDGLFSDHLSLGRCLELELLRLHRAGYIARGGHGGNLARP